MSVTDPIADLLTRIRNANQMRYNEVVVPSSKMKLEIVEILKNEGYIASYKIDKMLHEIYRNEALKEKIKGIIFGDFYLEENEIMPILEEYSQLFNVPTWHTLDITHKENNVTLPFGKNINL